MSMPTTRVEWVVRCYSGPDRFTEETFEAEAAALRAMSVLASDTTGRLALFERHVTERLVHTVSAAASPFEED